MEIKGLLDKIRQKEEKKKEFFFALQIEPESVKSAIWTIEEEQVKVFSLGSTEKWQNEEQLLQSVDTTLSSASQKFSSQENLPEPNKVVLGLPKEWISQDKITPDKGEILKKIFKKLELNPVGFVVTTEAIIHSLKTTEGMPPTAVIVRLGTEKISIALVNLGKIIDVKQVDRSGNLGADLTEGLSRFEDQSSFPARILLYGGRQIEEAKQELVNYSWQEGRVNFLHLPRVETLEPDFDIKAIALAGGEEVGKAEIKKPLVVLTEESPKEEEFIPEATADNFESMGFVKGKDISEEKPLKGKIISEEVRETPEMMVNKPTLRTRKLTLPRVDFSSIGKFFFRLKEKFPLKKVRFDFAGRVPLIVALTVVLLAALGIILVVLWWYLPSAQIIIWAKTQTLEKDFTIKLDPSLTIANREELALPVEKIETSVSGEKSSITTGTKVIGDPAKGEITIYNRTVNEKSFTAGTEIVGPNNLKFTLDDKVSVASESAGSDYTSIPGKAKIKVTAAAIGTEGNLASGTEFVIANLAKSDYVAKNEAVFVGGTSREIQVVSKKDQEKLITELTTELKNKALEELKGKTPSEKKIVEESLLGKINEQTFNKEVDEEASDLKLTLQIKFSALAFSTKEYEELVQEEIQKSVPEGYEYKSGENDYSFTFDKITKEGVVIATSHLKANLLPVFDLQEIKKSLSGKHVDIGEGFLRNLNNTDSFEAKISPPLPHRLAVFPRNLDKIKIEIKVK